MYETTKTAMDNTVATIDKLKVKINRIRLALEPGARNPYYYSESDLKRVTRQLTDAEARLKMLTNRAKKEDAVMEKTIPVIEEFLATWKEAVKQQYIEVIPKYEEEIHNFQVSRSTLRNEAVKSGIRGFREIDKYLNDNGYGDNEYNKLKSRYPSDIENYTYMTDSEREKRLEKDLTIDVNNKREMFMARITEVVGNIQDASGLSIGLNGEINGYVIGDIGTAAVTTITAGGYNIQRFHFRVLVRKSSRQ